MRSTLVITTLLFSSYLSATVVDVTGLNDGFPKGTLWSPATQEASYTKASPGIDAIKYSLEMIAYKDEAKMDFVQTIQFRLDRDRVRISLDAGEALDISTISINGQLVRYWHKDDQLTFFVNTPLSKGTLHSLKIHYQLDLANNPAISVHSNGQRITQMASFTQPLNSRNWFVSHDVPGDKVQYEILAHIPRPWGLMSNGTLVYEADAADNYRTFKYEMSHPIPTYLISIVIGEFHVVEDSWKGIPLSYWYDDVAGEEGLKTMLETPKMMDYFERLYFKYPFEKYNITGTSAMRGGAMEHTTATTFDASGLSGPSGVTISLHELAHHWFGDTVTCGDWDHIWLNESFATFSQLDYIRDQDGHEAYIEMLQKQKQSYFLTESENGSLGPLVNFQTDPETKIFGPHGVITYDKGSVVLNYLRTLLGDEAFFLGVRNYLKDKDLYMGIAYTSDLKKHLETASKQDLTTFFDQFIYQGGRPVLKLKQWSATHYQLTQVQAPTLGAFDLQILMETYGEQGLASKKKIRSSQTVTDLRIAESEHLVLDPYLEIPGEMSVDLSPETSRHLLKTAPLSAPMARLLIDDLGRKSALSFSDWKQIYEIHSANTSIRAALIYFGVKFLDMTKTMNIAQLEPISDQPIQIRKDLVSALSNKIFSPEELKAFSGQFIEWFSNEKAYYDVLLPLAETLSNNSLPIQDQLKKYIELGLSEGSRFFGYMLRALVRIDKDKAFHAYKWFLTDPRGNYRGRAAYAFSLLKSDEVATAIGDALKSEHTKSDYQNYRYFTLPMYLDALFEIRTEIAKEYVTEFSQNEGYTDEERSNAKSLLEQW